MIYIFLRNRKVQFADSLWSKRICRNSAGRCIDRVISAIAQGYPHQFVLIGDQVLIGVLECKNPVSASGYQKLVRTGLA